MLVVHFLSIPISHVHVDTGAMLLGPFISVLFAIIAVSYGQTVEGPYPESASKISAELLSLLENGDTPDVMVTFVGGNAEPLQRTSLLQFDDRDQRSEAIYQSLVEHSDNSQSGVIQMLSTRSADEGDLEFKKFWITNEMWVRGGDLKTIREIAENPQVADITLEPVMELIDGRDEGEDSRGGVVSPDFWPRPEDGEIQWPMEMVRAPEAWEELGGNQGEGVVVGILDSGVRHTHETLRDNFLGEYGWYDPLGMGSTPLWRNYHGTTVTGLAVGSRGIGVAPGAKWSACRGCGCCDCLTSELLACGEFFACPTLTNGTGRDCSKAPHVIVNSWGGRERQEFIDMVEVWRNMGIIPIFAIGNGGRSGRARCGSTRFPGRLPTVIGVGSVNINVSTDNTSSSKGPTEDRRLKPEIVAPGENVPSCSGIGDVDYRIDAGTSFSCPIVAGVIALLLSRDKNMGYEKVTEFLFNHTDQQSLKIPTPDPDELLPQLDQTCGAVKDGVLVFPNNIYGHGLVNAYEAVKAQTQAMSNGDSV